MVQNFKIARQIGKNSEAKTWINQAFHLTRKTVMRPKENEIKTYRIIILLSFVYRFVYRSIDIILLHVLHLTNHLSKLGYFIRLSVSILLLVNIIILEPFIFCCCLMKIFHSISSKKY